MLGTVQHEYFEKTAGNSAQAHVLIVLYFPLPSLHLLKYNAWYEDHIDPWSVSRLGAGNFSITLGFQVL